MKTVIWTVMLVGLMFGPLAAQDEVEIAAVLDLGDSVTNADGERRSLVYELNLVTGEFFTLDLLGEEAYATLIDPVTGASVDSQYEDWSSDHKTYIYRATAEVYQLRINADHEFTLSLESGDSLRSFQGRLSLGDLVSGSISDDEVFVYDLQISPDDHFTLWIDQPDVWMTVYDDRGEKETKFSHWGVDDGEGITEVYPVTGSTEFPHTLVVRGEGDYTIQLEAGDTLRQWQPPLSPGDAVSGAVDDGEAIAYELQGITEDYFTLYSDNTDVAFKVSTTESSHVNTDFLLWREGIVRVYQSRFEPPYFVTVTGRGSYTLRFEDGDTLRDFQPPLSPGDTVTGRLEDGQVLAFGLQVPENEPITISIVDENVMNPVGDIFPSVVDAWGVSLDAEYQDYDQINSERIWVYSGDELTPHTLQLTGAGEYSVRLESGDLARDVQPPLALGDVINGVLEDGQVLAYELEVSEGEFFTLSVDNPDIDIIMKDDLGNYRQPQTFEYDENGGMLIYFVEYAPYNLSLEGLGDFVLTLTAGDTVRTISQPLAVGDTITDIGNADQPGIYPLDLSDLSLGTPEFTVRFESESENAYLMAEIEDAFGFENTSLFSAPFGQVHRSFFGDTLILMLYGEEGVSNTVSIEAGDTIRRFGGDLVLGDVVTDAADSEGSPYVRYDLDVPYGEFHTLHITGSDEIWMRDLFGIDIPIQHSVRVYDAATQTYDARYVYWNSAVEEVSPTLTVSNFARTADSSVTTALIAGDDVRVDGGTIGFGETIRSRTESPQTIRYQLDAESLGAISPGDEITIRQAAPGGVSSLVVALSSERGPQEPVEDESLFFLGNIYSVVYRFSLNPNAEFYSITVFADGEYTLTVSKNSNLPPAESLSPPDDTSTPSASAADATGCQVNASAQVNQRSGPGTNFDVAGTLAAGETTTVSGQVTAADGFVWWHLDTGAWVRSDVVSALGNCEVVPIVE